MNEPAAPWRRLATDFTCSPQVLAELLDGGQAFRWHRQPADTWIGQWSHHAVALRLDDGGRLHWRELTAAEPEQTATALLAYLNLADDHSAAALDALPWRSDPHLRAAMAAFPGLRILRQPLGETLLAFLCSATKQIVQIKQMLALLAKHHGTPAKCHTLYDTSRGPRLPTWEQLAQVPEAELRKCQLGFRARYIAQTAAVIAAQPDWLTETEAADYPTAKQRLMSLPGVGEKVADCVALFGLGHLEAFPVDTWIIKAMARRYGLAGWSPRQIAHFGRVHFGPAAGLAQQYLFAWERHHGGR